MKIWKNTATLEGYDEGLIFTDNKSEADIVLIGSKTISLEEFSNLKGIFRAGIGKDNIPLERAQAMGLVVHFPSKETIDIIYEETANFTCGLIFRMLYSEVGTIEPWLKRDRMQLAEKVLVVIGKGNIGSKVAEKMSNFMLVKTYDVLHNSEIELKYMLSIADCITLHIPKSKDNLKFIDRQKLSWMKDGAVVVNTARGAIIDEEALYMELLNDRLRAAFDVYWHEPYYGKLKEFYPSRFYMTPHVASTCKGFIQGCRHDLDNLIRELSYA